MLLRYYDKILVGCCFFAAFVNMGLASTSFSVHQPYIVAIPGIGDTGGSLILSVRTLVSLIVMVFVDRYYNLLDVRRGLLLASLFTAAGFVVYSTAHNLPVFFAGAVLLGLGYGFGGMVSVTYLVNRWFVSGVGAVVGIASMGSGLASIVIPPIVAHIIESSSLSAAFLTEGTLAAALGIAVFLVLRNRPSDLNLKPYDRQSKSAKPRKKQHRYCAPAEPLPRGEHLAVLAAMAGVGLFACCGMTYMSVLATSTGYSTAFAALLVSIAGAALTAAKFAAGELFDHVGTPLGSAIMFSMALIGFVLCSFANLGNVPLMVIGALFIGAGLSLGSVGISIWSLDMSDAAHRAREIKNFQVAYAFGGFLANTLPGIIKDLVGSYVVSYMALTVVTVLSAFIVLRYYRRAEAAFEESAQE